MDPVRSLCYIGPWMGYVIVYPIGCIWSRAPYTKETVRHPQVFRMLTVGQWTPEVLERHSTDPINPSMGRFERNRNFNYSRHDDEFKLKVDIPTFSGDLDIEGFLDWITDVYCFFEYMEILEERKVKLVVF